jgi:hypothetical protein
MNGADRDARGEERGCRKPECRIGTSDVGERGQRPFRK